MMLNYWLSHKKDASPPESCTKSECIQQPIAKTKPVELTTDEIYALALCLGEDSESRFCFSKIFTDETSEEAMATDGIQCLILHVPELNADSELYAIPVSTVPAASDKRFPKIKSILEPPSENTFLVDLQRLERVIQALRLIVTEDADGRQDVRLYQGQKSGQIFFTARTERGKATAVLATMEDRWQSQHKNKESK